MVALHKSLYSSYVYYMTNMTEKTNKIIVMNVPSSLRIKLPPKKFEEGDVILIKKIDPEEL